ncbi:hypothetical protein GE300_15965 [Rhodobacteraceae bacterium 2CG4]|uniref:Uncharacterized protein n=1 Tax=Halovulum marinum TaxID=2662447 RepID=A0A6L5Z3F4_9RHOB|nr:hypothetical protein [Halovulum marinum]MSU91086.1 hypothetical protein [Halovulum marinum]
MTALDRYIRLEAAGRWREAPDAAWREVLVSFGNATLVLSSFDEEPLTHWSLAATGRVAFDGGVALYAPDAGTDEVLEVRDRDMIEAIAEVSRMARVRGRAAPRMRRLRRLLLPAAVATGLAALGWAAPDALRARAYALVTAEQAEQIAGRIRAALDRPACLTPEGRRSLRRLTGRAAPGVRVEVMAWDAPPAAILPDGSVLLSRRLVERAPAAEVVAGWLALAAAGGRDASALRGWTRDLGVTEAMAFLTSGRIGPGDVAEMARQTAGQTAPPAPAAVAAAVAALAGRGIDPRPFLDDLRRRFPDLAVPAPPVPEGLTPALPRDADWVALQNICES